tara:strand:- start:33 stop:182 length:150 start_codon:yes stop_codon:yes gene_type:complete
LIDIKEDSGCDDKSNESGNENSGSDNQNQEKEEAKANDYQGHERGVDRD